MSRFPARRNGEAPVIITLAYTGSSFPVVIDTGVVGSGSYTVMILGTITATGEPIAVGEATFAIPGI